jgi:uncharacterized protein (TIGR02145 family)
MVLRFFILAVAFLLSCTSIERDSVCDEKSINYNGCVGGVLSSSSGHVSSSSSGSIVYGVPVTYQGETYKTVVIGTQTWMARNLNYAVPGSKCGGDGQQLKDENTSYCNAYGRLYDWATAMALPDSCNSSSCASQVGAKHQGICPSGWHIPNNGDWDKLVNYVESNKDCRMCAARYLKYPNGWEGNSNYQDPYGFSALPGGFGNSDGTFFPGDGYWWGASAYSKNEVAMHSAAANVSMFVNIDYGYLYSVRCLQE